MKILQGMNSNTFNYLEINKQKLNVAASIPVFHDSRGKNLYPELKKITFWAGEEINTVKFFSMCVRYNKPCVVNDFAKRFEAFKQWSTKDNAGAFDYMQHLIGKDKEVTVYQQPEQDNYGRMHKNYYENEK